MHQQLADLPRRTRDAPQGLHNTIVCVSKHLKHTSMLQARQGAMARATNERKAKLERQLARSAKASSSDTLVSVDSDAALVSNGKNGKVLAGSRPAKKARSKLLPWLSTTS